jgi:hypothetical protein
MAPSLTRNLVRVSGSETIEPKRQGSDPPYRRRAAARYRLQLEKAATPLTPGTAAAAFVVYTFVATCASALAQVPALLAGRKTGLKELGARRAAPVPRVPPVPASHLVRTPEPAGAHGRAV